MLKEAERTFCEILKVYIEGEKKKKTVNFSVQVFSTCTLIIYPAECLEVLWVIFFFSKVLEDGIIGSAFSNFCFTALYLKKTASVLYISIGSSTF